jgi:hypothetical protein
MTLVVLSVSVMGPSNVPAFANNEDVKQLAMAKIQESAETIKTRVSSSIIIDAPPDLVWQGIHEERKHDPYVAYTKHLRQDKESEVLEQKLIMPSMLGTAVAILHCFEIPFKRIDYKLMKSDHFRCMEGSWVLTPVSEGRKTKLELSSRVELGVPLPKIFVNKFALNKIEKRLEKVKEVVMQIKTKIVQAQTADSAKAI